MHSCTCMYSNNDSYCSSARSRTVQQTLLYLTLVTIWITIGWQWQNLQIIVINKNPAGYLMDLSMNVKINTEDAINITKPLVFVCITGQVGRLLLAEKKRTIINPLTVKGFGVVTAIIQRVRKFQFFLNVG